MNKGTFDTACDALTQCYDAMQEVVNEGSLHEFFANMSPNERESFRDLRSQLWCVVDAYDEVATLAVEYGIQM